MSIESITGRTQTPVNVKLDKKADGDVESAGAAQTVKTTQAADSIAITSVAQGIKKAFESTSASDSIDFNRVREVKKALEDNSYSMDAEKVAKKLIEFERLLT